MHCSCVHRVPWPPHTSNNNGTQILADYCLSHACGYFRPDMNHLPLGQLRPLSAAGALPCLIWLTNPLPPRHSHITRFVWLSPDPDVHTVSASRHRCTLAYASSH